jgi:hypothetical protein
MITNARVFEQSGGESCFWNKNERANDRNSRDGEQRQGARGEGRTRTHGPGRKDTKISRPGPSLGGHGNPHDTTLQGHVLYQDSPVYSTKNTMTAWPAFLGFWERRTKSEEIMLTPRHHGGFVVFLEFALPVMTGRWFLKGPIREFIRSLSHEQFGQSRSWASNHENGFYIASKITLTPTPCRPFSVPAYSLWSLLPPSRFT